MNFKESYYTSSVFKTSNKKLFPEIIDIKGELNSNKADVDIIIASYRFPELTNLTIQNYLKYETNLKINILVVESAGDKKIYDQLIQKKNVSRILISQDVKINHRFGTPSFGLALSYQIGQQLGSSKYIFFSHCDMLAIENNFLSYIVSKLNDNTRIASFTQRHIIPFTGCMIAKREAIEELKTDWLPQDNNNYLNVIEGLKFIDKNKLTPLIEWIDCGEAILYEELSKDNSIYICSSVGGSDDLQKTPFDYFEANATKTKDILTKSGIKIVYEKLPEINERFVKKNKKIFKPSIGFLNSPKKPDKYWRYTVNGEGEIIFIHHGRGTTKREVKDWIKFSRKINSR
jgi:hypothetical protein